MSEPIPDDLTFEKALEELEKIVRDLEDGRIGLEEALSRYEAGVHLITLCYSRLNQAEQRIQKLAGLDEEGKPVLQPFRHEATAGSDKPEPRPRRKKESEY